MSDSGKSRSLLGRAGSWFVHAALDILRGAVIGLANVIPGVSGGTMMVSMGIYDKIIYCINHLLKEFKRSVTILLPYLVGMVLAIVLGAFALKGAFRSFPLPTNTLFIGLIVGSLPMILKQLKGEKTGPIGLVIFLIFFGLVVWQKLSEAENTVALTFTFWDMVKYFLLGMIASATMVIPGVSGSMMLKTLGYYEPIVTEALPGAVSALLHGEWSALGHNLLVLLPFALGIVVGIFAIAKLISLLMRKAKGWTYCGILGMVVASPVVILMDKGLYEQVTWVTVAVSLLTFAAGFAIAIKMGGEPTEAA